MEQVEKFQTSLDPRRLAVGPALERTAAVMAWMVEDELARQLLAVEVELTVDFVLALYSVTEGAEAVVINLVVACLVA